jgi:hypothetical protein
MPGPYRPESGFLPRTGDRKTLTLALAAKALALAARALAVSRALLPNPWPYSPAVTVTPVPTLRWVATLLTLLPVDATLRAVALPLL